MPSEQVPVVDPRGGVRRGGECPEPIGEVNGILEFEPVHNERLVCHGICRVKEQRLLLACHGRGDHVDEPGRRHDRPAAERHGPPGMGFVHDRVPVPRVRDRPEVVPQLAPVRVQRGPERVVPFGARSITSWPYST